MMIQTVTSSCLSLKMEEGGGDRVLDLPQSLLCSKAVIPDRASLGEMGRPFPPPRPKELFSTSRP